MIRIKYMLIFINLIAYLLSIHSFRHIKYQYVNYQTKIINKSKDIKLYNEITDNNINNNIKLNINQLKTFISIALPYFQSNKQARESLLGVIALTLANSGVSVAFSYISRDFYNALNIKNEQLFYEKVEYFFIAIVIAVPISVYYRYLRDTLSLSWREGLTNVILNKYYSNKTFYMIENINTNSNTSEIIDNPDQRIADDIRSFTKTSLDFFISIFTSLIDLFSFSAILYQIYPSLFLAIVGYSFIGSYITVQIGKNLVSLNYNKLKSEANFRYNLIRTREYSESIAFYDQNAIIEKNDITKLFNVVKLNQIEIIDLQKQLEGFTTTYRYLPNILPSLIIGPLYFRGEVELGIISQSYSAFNHILNDFSILMNQFEYLSAFSAGISRLESFITRLDDISNMANQTNKIHMSVSNTNPFNRLVLQCRNLSVFTPDLQRVLIGGAGVNDGIDVDIYEGDKLLIVGPSGAGKSTFIRAIAGLWEQGSGEVNWYLPSSSSQLLSQSSLNSTDVFFLPQKPYNIIGCLRDQIKYPSIVSNSSESLNDTESDNYLLDILSQVKLNDLASRVGQGDSSYGLNGVDLDWSKILSLGEQQRLAFARVLYHNPKVVVLDESTSALDVESERAMYSLLNDLKVTYVSVGHRPTLLSYHDKRLTLLGPNTFPILKSILETTDNNSTLSFV